MFVRFVYFRNHVLFSRNKSENESSSSEEDTNMEVDSIGGDLHGDPVLCLLIVSFLTLNGPFLVQFIFSYFQHFF